MSKHAFGKPLNILKFTEDGKVLIDSKELERMLLHREVKNRKVVVASIIGAFRKGKSFFLDYCLRYLYANYKSIANPNNPLNNKNDWMDDGDEPLKGFSWRSGTKRDTTGIVMWSDVFLHTCERTGEKLAIILIDTQGLFDNETSSSDNSRIFALGTLISSLQILNLFSMIQEDHLQYLQFATEFAKFVARDDRNVNLVQPFQNLIFMVRDWNNPDEFEFGLDGGERYLLENVLQIKEKQQAELRSVREVIHSSFEDIKCCLLPYPGKAVARDKKYDGRWSEMDEEFKDDLFKIIPFMLKPSKLVLKKINNNSLKCFELKEYIETYFKVFQSDEMPQAQSIYELTVERQMSLLVSECFDSYKRNIIKNEDLLCEENLYVFHEMSKDNTLLLFKDAKKMGNANHERTYIQKLEDMLENYYKEWSNHSLKSFQQMAEEKKKVEEAIKERNQMEMEAIEAERQTRERLEELERQKEMQLIEQEKYETAKQLNETRLEAERERTRAIEAERKAEEALRKAAEHKLEAEGLKNNRDRRDCTIL